MPQYETDPNIDLYQTENAFYLQSHPTRMAKLLAHYELYRQVSHLPGAVVEAGVYKGASLMRFAAFRDVLETNHSRAIIGFDAFGAFPRDAIESISDQAFIDRFENAGGEGIGKAHLSQLFEAKGYGNIDLVEGDVFKTMPDFLSRKPETRIALLHLDLDVYEPTAFALETLLPHMVRGGIIVFDDYGVVEGATRAADEVCATLKTALKKLPNYSVPAYLSMP